MADYSIGEWSPMGEMNYERMQATAHGNAMPSTHGTGAGAVYGGIHENENITVNSDDAEWLFKYGKGNTIRSIQYALARKNSAVMVGGGLGTLVGFWFLYWLRALVHGG